MRPEGIAETAVQESSSIPGGFILLAPQHKPKKDGDGPGSRKKGEKTDTIAPMKPGFAGQKAREAVENGHVSFHWGHLSHHLGEQYQSHEFDVQDIYNAIKDPAARVVPAQEFFHQGLRAFIYELYGKSAGVPIRVVFYFKVDRKTGELLMILTGFIDVPERKRSRKLKS